MPFSAKLALVALVLGCAPVLPGFLGTIKALEVAPVSPVALDQLLAAIARADDAFGKFALRRIRRQILEQEAGEAEDADDGVAGH